MILEKLQQAFPGEILETHDYLADLTVVIRKEKLHLLLAFLKNEPGLEFEMLIDLCGADYLPKVKSGEARFELVYHLYSLTHNHRLRVRVKVSAEDMTVPTVTDLWQNADWCEREAFDMFGYQFHGHPNLKRLLMFDGFEGHPLRKDYPIAKRQKIPVPREVL